MTEDEVVSFWSKNIFPDNSPESYSANFPFAQSRLLYVIQTIGKYLQLDSKSSLKFGDFATGEGVLLHLLRTHYPKLQLFGTEHSAELASKLRREGFEIDQRSLGGQEIPNISKQLDISTLTWTLANAINPLSVLKDVVANTKQGGIVCVAESSRILVPFRKSLKDYFSRTLPADVHPSNFSANTLRCIMQLCGLEIIYINRYFDSDVLLVIGKKVEYAPKITFFDEPNRVVAYFREWEKASRYFETLR